VGESLRDDQRQALPDASAPVLLKMDNVKVGDTGPVSFELRAGEMVALAGLRAPVRKRLDVCCLPAGRRKVDKSH
jgi:ABC-type sugar transport system ATPase subunit